MATSNPNSNSHKVYRSADLSMLIERCRALSINHMHIDSRQIQIGDAFIALKGINSNGSEFITEAIAKGAAVIIVDAEADFAPSMSQANFLKVESLNNCLATIAQQFYEHSNIPTIIGITGTNGKTTIAHGLAQALNHCGCSAWIAGTLGYGPLNGLVNSNNTTLDVVSNWRLIHTAAEDQVQYLVMEVSSHAIAQGRIENIPYDLAVFTNLSRDHIDYHGTMEAYAATKLSFLTQPNTKQVLINACDAIGAKWLKDLAFNSLAFSSIHTLSADLAATSQDWRIQSIKCQPHGLSLELDSCNHGLVNIKSELIGEFNATNLAQMFISLICLGFDIDVSRQAVEKIQPITGRMQRIKQVGKPLVIVDYAHTPDALEKALLAIQSHRPNMIHCVFGCGGDRDAGKRAIMGEIAVRLADKVVVTSDNPRTESPDAIVDDIVEGAVTNDNISADKLTVILEREQAIHFAINRASVDDIVLIAGKGHEDYQEVAGQRKYFSDQLAALQALEAVA
jgi:UDP-N-acetylmuramoyl-L-alanyl-D-glutamate--2,6-diaminopimelate ligase